MDELWNPPGRQGEPLASLADAIEAAACVGLARWISDHRPDIDALELDGGGGDLWLVNVMRVSTAPVFVAVGRGDDVDLWSAATECWQLLVDAGRADRRVITPDESASWMRGWE